MSMIARLRSLTRNLFRREAVERELDDELRAYVDALTAEKVRAGMDAGEARRASLIEAGGVEQVKEAVRDSRAGAFIDDFMRDLRHVFRGLGVRQGSRSPSGRR